MRRCRSNCWRSWNVVLVAVSSSTLEWVLWFIHLYFSMTVNRYIYLSMYTFTIVPKTKLPCYRACNQGRASVGSTRSGVSPVLMTHLGRQGWCDRELPRAPPGWESGNYSARTPRLPQIWSFRHYSPGVCWHRSADELGGGEPQATVLKTSSDASSHVS